MPQIVGIFCSSALCSSNSLLQSPSPLFSAPLSLLPTECCCKSLIARLGSCLVPLLLLLSRLWARPSTLANSRHTPFPSLLPPLSISHSPSPSLSWSFWCTSHPLQSCSLKLLPSTNANAKQNKTENTLRNVPKNAPQNGN